MKCLFTLIFSLLCFGTIWAQEPSEIDLKIDSINKVIATAKSDTLKGRSLCRLCHFLRRTGQMEAALQKGNEGLAILTNSKDLKGKGECLRYIGILYIFQGDPQRSLDCYFEALKAFEQIKNDRGIGQVYLSIGLNYNDQGNYKEAMIWYQKCLLVAQKCKDHTLEYDVLFNMGSIYGMQGNYDESMRIFQRSIRIAQMQNNAEDMINAWCNIGVIYEKKGDYPKALQAYHNGLKLAEKKHDGNNIINIMSNIASLYNALADYSNGERYYFKAKKIAEKTRNRRDMGFIWGGLGQLYYDKKDYNKSLSALKQAVAIGLEINEKSLVSASYHYLAEIALLKNDYDSALQYLHPVLTISKETANNEYYTATLIRLGKAYYYKDEMQRARRYALEGFNLVHRNGALNVKQSAAKILALIEAQLGNYKDAYRYQGLFKQYSDSLKNDENAKAIGKLEAQYEYKKQQEKQAVIDAEHRLRTNFTYSAIIGVVLVLTGFIFYRYRAKAKLNRALQDINEELASKNEEILTQRDELAIRNEEITTQRDELAAQSDQIVEQRDQLDKAYYKLETAFHKLKELDEFKEAMSGMIVHDLKNPLSSIIGISNKERLTPNDQVTIRQAGKHLLNLTLNFLDVQKFEQAKVPLNLRDEALLTIVQDAVDQVSLLIANKNLQLSISIQPTTGVFCDFELISRVLMNLLTNAIKYTPNNGKIIISAEEMPDNHVQISVSDTGQGIPADKLESVFDKFSQVEARKSGSARSTGLGLTFCKLTIEAHGGHIHVESEVGIGTTFYFTLSKALKEVKAVQPFSLPANDLTVINLTEEDKTRLEPFLEKLQALDVYEAGEVLKIIAQVPESQALSAWKSEMERTIFASNKERFDELINNYELRITN